jgi:hypothetical protein
MLGERGGMLSEQSVPPAIRDQMLLPEAMGAPAERTEIMASSIGNTHTLKADEWEKIVAGEVGPWAKVAADQAAMHPSGGQLRVFVIRDGAKAEITAEVLAMAAG